MQKDKQIILISLKCLLRIIGFFLLIPSLPFGVLFLVLAEIVSLANELDIWVCNR